jgi:anti-sigma regulatory factor (Ser/Thr protein kinase)
MEGRPTPIVRALAPRLSSVSDARRLASKFAAALMTGDQLDKLALVVTEVMSNAVRHSASSEDVHLAITPKDDYLCVQVTDSGRGLVPQPGAIASEPGAGYGLFLVEQLARRWGMTREDGRTRVWLEIDFRPEATARGAASSQRTAV